MDSCVILLSGGLDSVVATAMMRESMRVSLALTFDYGQRAAQREVAIARDLCTRWEIPHQVVELPWLGEASPSALTQRARTLPHLKTSQLDEIKATTQSAQQVWVPNRNGVFLNVAAAIAEAKEISWIVAGFNREEAVTFPDNGSHFVEATNRALQYSTNGKVALISPTQSMTKTEIVAWGRKNNVPLDAIWPCYEGGETWCRHCESCLRFLRAIGD